MSTPTLAPPAGGSGDWDEFLEFAAIVEPRLRDPLAGPRIPRRPSRAELGREADQEIAEGFAAWLRERES